MKENSQIEVEPKTKKKPFIGSRHTSRHVVRRDDESGLYEEVNSRAYCDSESWVQSMLLAEKRPIEASTWSRRWGASLATSATIILLILVALAQMQKPAS